MSDLLEVGAAALKEAEFARLVIWPMSVSRRILGSVGCVDGLGQCFIGCYRDGVE
jgi:hypothetical protein